MLTFRADGAAADIRLQVPSELAPYAGCLFPDYRISGPRAPGSGTSGAPERPVVLRAERHGDGRFRIRTPSGAWALSGVSDAMVFLETTLAEALLHTVPDVRILHAGGCVVGNGSFVFPGFGGAGKSTLAAAFLDAGVAVLGDDVVLLEPGTGLVRPFKRRLKVPEDTRRRMGLPRPGTPLDDLWPDAAFYVPRELGGRWASGAPLRRVLFPTRRAGARPELRAVGPGEAVRRLLEQALLVRRPEGEDFEAVAEALDGAPVHELIYGEAPDAVGFVLGELAGRPGGAGGAGGAGS